MRGKGTKISILLFMFVCLMASATFTGCTYYNRSVENRPADDVKGLGLKVKVYGSYGQDICTSFWHEMNDIDTDYGMSFKAYDDRLFANSGDTIYEVIDNSLVEMYRHRARIRRIIGVSEDYVLFDAPERINEDGIEKNIDRFWIYYFATGEATLLTETGSMGYYYDDNEIIISNWGVGPKEWFIVYSNLNGEIQECICSGIDELPDNYDVYNRNNWYVIEKRGEDGTARNIGLTGYERNYAGEVVQSGGMTSQHRGNVGYSVFFYPQRADDTTVYNVVRNYYSDWDYLIEWKGDVIEKYDLPSKIGTVIFQDNVNAIIGFNYTENIVYGIRLGSSTLISGGIDDPINTWSELVEFRKGEEIELTWSGQYLFWKYIGDSSEEFGGAIKL